MGQVFRAHDTNNRDVALKVLPESVASDSERLARFTREAHTLWLLNHPNIAHLHGVEESGDVRALVMDWSKRESVTLIHRLSTIVSSPIGFRQHAAAALVTAIERESIASAAFELTTVRKFPKVVGTVPVTEKMLLEFLNPLIVYGIGVVLEYRSTDAKLNVDPPAATRISPLTVLAGSTKN